MCAAAMLGPIHGWAVSGPTKHLKWRDCFKALILGLHHSCDPSRGWRIVLVVLVEKDEFRWVTSDDAECRFQIGGGPEPEGRIVEPEWVRAPAQKVDLSVGWKCEDRIAGLSLPFGQLN